MPIPQSNPFEGMEPIYFYIDDILFVGRVDQMSTSRSIGPYGMITPTQAEIKIVGVEVGPAAAPGAAEGAPHFSSKKDALPEPQRRLPCPASSE